MMQNSLSAVVDQIVALVPVYSEQGDSTQLILRGGETRLQARTINSCLREMWQIYSFDWRAYRRQYSQLLHQRNLLPWPADVWRMFAPLKLRLPKVAGDAAYGYVAAEEVAHVVPAAPKQPAKVRIILHSGYELPVYLSPRETHRHLQAATYASQLFWGLRLEKPLPYPREG